MTNGEWSIEVHTSIGHLSSCICHFIGGRRCSTASSRQRRSPRCMRSPRANRRSPDSIVVNPHKSPSVPFDLSAFSCRRMDVLTRAFSLIPDYLRTSKGSWPGIVQPRLLRCASARPGEDRSRAGRSERSGCSMPSRQPARCSSRTTRLDGVLASRLAIGHFRTTEAHMARAWVL